MGNGRVVVCALLLLVLAAGSAAAKPVRVVATFTILGDMVARVGGENVAVRVLVGANGDAHVYEPTPSDVRAVAEADLLVENGLGMEGWMKRLGRAAAYQGPVVVASAGITPRWMVENGRQVADPHAWQDLANGRQYVANIAEGLAKADPTHAATYRANAERYTAELAELDTWVRSEIGAVPEPGRQIITSHQAFGYFAAAYGVTFHAPEGLSTEAEVTPRALANMILQIRKTGIRTVFIENMTNPRLIEQLAREAGVTVGGSLHVDALSPPGGPADSYIALFRANVSQMKRAMLRN